MKKGQSAAKILNKLDAKYVNKQFGVLKVIKFEKQIIHKKFYSALCTRCNNITIIRSDQLLKHPQSCGNCVNDLQKEIADNKYKELRKYRNIYNSYKSNAKSRNINFNLTLEKVIELVDSNCYYCGNIDSKGIDRLDSKQDYNAENIVPCCAICNMMKNKYSKNLFFEQISKIYNKHLK